jgi:hypothetical protein
MQEEQQQQAQTVVSDSTIDIVIAIYKEPIDWIPNFILELEKKCTRLRVFLYFKSEPNDQNNRIIFNNGKESIFRSNTIIQIEYLPNVGLCDHTYAWHIVNKEFAFENANPNRIVIFLTGSMPFILLKKWIFYQLLLTRLNLLANQTKLLGLIIHLNIQGGRKYVEPKDYCFHYPGKPKCPPVQFHHKEDSNHMNWHLRVFPEIPIPTYGVFKGIFAVHSIALHSVPKKYYERILNETSQSINPDAAYYVERTWYQLFETFYHPF